MCNEGMNGWKGKEQKSHIHKMSLKLHCLIDWKLNVNWLNDVINNNNIYVYITTYVSKMTIELELSFVVDNFGGTIRKYELMEVPFWEQLILNCSKGEWRNTWTDKLIYYFFLMTLNGFKIDLFASKI